MSRRAITLKQRNAIVADVEALLSKHGISPHVLYRLAVVAQREAHG